MIVLLKGMTFPWHQILYTTIRGQLIFNTFSHSILFYYSSVLLCLQLAVCCFLHDAVGGCQGVVFLQCGAVEHVWVRHQSSHKRNTFLIYVKQKERVCGHGCVTSGKDKRNPWWSSFEVPFPEVLGNTYWWSPNCLAWREQKADCLALRYKYSLLERGHDWYVWVELLQ